eukprot:Hpha_TRINITY_DN402_c0_g1::TRINITY_DN402_c0_g1_i1::g.27692::m.27692
MITMVLCRGRVFAVLAALAIGLPYSAAGGVHLWSAPGDGFYGHAGWSEWAPAATPELEPDGNDIWGPLNHSNKWIFLGCWIACMGTSAAILGYCCRGSRLSWFATTRDPRVQARMTEPQPGDKELKRARSPIPDLPPAVPLEWAPPAGVAPDPLPPHDRGGEQEWDPAVAPEHAGHELPPPFFQAPVEMEPVAQAGETRVSVVAGWYAQEVYNGEDWIPVHYYDAEQGLWREWSTE